MVGRGGGKITGNRNMAHGRLQNSKQPARNMSTVQDGRNMNEDVGGTEQDAYQITDHDVAVVTKNLNRQRVMNLLDKETESPTFNDNNLEQATICVHQAEVNEAVGQPDFESGIIGRPESQLGKRKRMSKLAARISQAMQVKEATDPRPRAKNAKRNNDVQQGNAEVGMNEGTSKTREKGNRGKYKSYVVDMKIKGKGSKLTIEIPDDIDRAIGENARHLVNECGRVVRTKAPLNVANWQEAFSRSGESMWKEIQDKFQIVESSRSLKMYAFVVDTMQRLYRLWKCRLHYYYKSPKCGKTDEERVKNPPPDLPQDQWEYCVKRYASDEFKVVSERNSKNRRSDNRVIHTTGNLAFVEVEDILTKENNNVKPSADVVWLIEHTHQNEKEELEWADGTHSKTIHNKLKDVVANVGDSMTQEEILTQVLGSRSGYIRGKGTAVRNFVRGKQQLEQRKIVEEQQEKIHEQEQRIKDLEESHQKQQREFEEHKAQQAAAMEAFKAELLQQIATRGV